MMAASPSYDRRPSSLAGDERGQQYLKQLSASASTFEPRFINSVYPSPNSSSYFPANAQQAALTPHSTASSPSTRLRAESRPFNPRGFSDQPTDEVPTSSRSGSASPSLPPAITGVGQQRHFVLNAQSHEPPDLVQQTESSSSDHGQSLKDEKALDVASPHGKKQSKRALPYRNPERHTSGGPPPPSSKLSAQELEERMARIRLQNEGIMKRAAEVEDDKQVFQENARREREAQESAARAKRERDRIVQRQVEDERRKVRERKESRKSNREWDAMKGSKKDSTGGVTQNGGNESTAARRPTDPPAGQLDWAEDQ